MKSANLPVSIYLRLAAVFFAGTTIIGCEQDASIQRGSGLLEEAAAQCENVTSDSSSVSDICSNPGEVHSSTKVDEFEISTSTN